jgi:hypothetical protein
MKKLFTFLSLSLLCIDAHAQNLHWVQKHSGSIFACKVLADNCGHIYVGGNAGPYTDFDPGPGFYYAAGGVSGMFIHKLDTNGNIIWAKVFEGNAYLNEMAILGDTALAFTGGLYGQVDFDPGAGTYLLNTQAMSDPFVAKIDSAGNLKWGKKIGGPWNIEEGFAVCFDYAGNVFFAGRAGDSVDYDPGTGTLYMNHIIPGTNEGAFIEKLSPDGDLLWARKLPVYINDGLVVDHANNVYVSGRLDFPGDMDPGVGVQNLDPANGSLFIESLDPNGNLVWVKQYGNLYTSHENLDFGHWLTIDGSDNLFTAGVFVGTGDFDPDAGSTYNMTSSNGYGYVLKLRPTGELLWADQLNCLPNAIINGPDDDCYMVGRIQGTADLDPGVGSFNITAQGSTDMFMLKLNGSGGFEWAKSFIDPTQNNRIRAVAVDVHNNLYSVGSFSDTTDFDPGINTHFLVATLQSPNPFYLKMGTYEMLDVEDVLVHSSLYIYPNPTDGKLTISIDGNNTSEGTITIADLLGRPVAMMPLDGRAYYEIDLSGQANGLYLVQVQTARGKTSQKIVLAR